MSKQSWWYYDKLYVMYKYLFSKNKHEYNAYKTKKWNILTEIVTLEDNFPKNLTMSYIQNTKA